jgi:hypothetical protein
MNNLQEAYLSIYQNQLDEALDPEERALRRAEIADKKASRMDPKVAKKYSDSEAKSAEREDKKSKGKHIHGMADSVELDGEMVESAVPGKPAERVDALTKIDIPQKERDAARERTLAKAKEMREKNKKKIRESSEDLEEKKGLWDNIHAKRKRGERPAKPGEKGYPKTLNVEELDQIIEGIKQARQNVGASKCWTNKKLGNPPTKMKGGKEVPNCVPEEVEIQERALDTAEKKEKERLVRGMKKSAAGFKERYGERAKSVMYATATKQAKQNMDTSRSDRRYAVEGVSMDEAAEAPEAPRKGRKPSEIAKREKLQHLIDKIRDKKEGKKED